MTAFTGAWRSSRERSVMASRPAFGVALIGVTPMTETTPVTSGSLRIAFSTVACSRFISVNEMSCPPSMTAKMRPVSCSGRNPLGMMM